MGKALSDLLKEQGNGKAAPVPLAQSMARGVAADVKEVISAPVGSEPVEKRENLPLGASEEYRRLESVQAIVAGIEKIEIEAVVGGALQRITFGESTNPAEVREILLFLDPQAKVRDAFPMKGNYGSRETKLARVFVITVRVTDSGKFIDITADDAGDDLSIAVSKKNADAFYDQIAALGKLSDANLAKIKGAIDNKGQATINLGKTPEQIIGVKYWKSEDGKAFAEGFQAEPPAAAEAGEEKTA